MPEGFGSEFKNLSLQDKNSYLLDTSPTFKSLSPRERTAYLNEVQYGEPEKIPGIFSGEYSSPMTVGKKRIQSTVAPGETLPHAAARQIIGGAGRAFTPLIHPVETLKSMGESLLPSKKRTLPPGTTLRQGIEQAPVMGDPFRSFQEEAEKGTLAPAGELATYSVVGESAKALKAPVVGKVKEWRGSPERGIANITKSLSRPTGKGGIKAAEGAAADKAAANDLSVIQRESPLQSKGGERFHELARNIGEHQKRIWDEAHKPQIQRWENEPTDPQYLVSQAERALPKDIADAAPGETAKARVWIKDVLSKPRTVGELDAFLRDLNNDIEGKPAEPYGPKEFSVRYAAAKAIRNEIDRVLEKNGEPGVREFNRRWGALENVRESAVSKGFDELKKEGKAGPIPDWLHAYAFLHPGAFVPAVGAGFRLGGMLRPTPSRILKRGMKQLARSPLKSPTMPQFRLTAPGRLPFPTQSSVGLEGYQPELTTGAKRLRYGYFPFEEQ